MHGYGLDPYLLFTSFYNTAVLNPERIEASPRKSGKEPQMPLTNIPNEPSEA